MSVIDDVYKAMILQSERTINTKEDTTRLDVQAGLTSLRKRDDTPKKENLGEEAPFRLPSITKLFHRLVNGANARTGPCSKT